MTAHADAVIAAAGMVGLLLVPGRAGAVLRWPATVAHELAHLLVAWLTLSRPTGFSLWPQRQPDGTKTLGYVRFQPRLWTGALVALAPLTLWAGAYAVLWLRPAAPLLQEAVAGLACSWLLLGGWPSCRDWYIAVRYPLGLAAMALLAAALAA